MIDLHHYLSEQLDAPMSQFKAVLQRLLNTGVISRDESSVESGLYDAFVRCEDAIIDYLAVLDIQVAHDRHARFIRLIAPGALAPGLESEFSAKSSAFRQSLTQDDIDVLLMLRVQYEQGLRTGELNDQGDVTQSFEGFNLALFNILGKRLPAGISERRQLFRRLRQLRVVGVNLEDLDDMNGWFSIKSSITSYVSESVLKELETLLEAESSPAGETLETEVPETDTVSEHQTHQAVDSGTETSASERVEQMQPSQSDASSDIEYPSKSLFGKVD